MSEIQPTARRHRRWLMPVLIVSLVFNFLILGVASARAIHHMGGYGHHGHHAGQMFHRLGRHLPDEVRDAIREAMREGRGDKAQRVQRFQQMRSVMEDAATRLQAEPFDRDGFEASILAGYEGFRESMAVRVQRFATTLADALADLPADERREAGEEMMETLEEWQEKMNRYHRERRGRY